MVALTEAVVLGPSLVLLGAFVVAWHYQFDALPPVRATAAVALAVFLFVYSLASILELLAEPVQSAVILGGSLLLLAAGRHAWRRVRA